MHFDFCPYKAFRLIDTRNIQHLDAYDMVNFLRKNYIQARLESCEQLVSEYQSSTGLDFSNFCGFVLPQEHDKKKRAALERHLSAAFNKGNLAN